MHCDTQSFLALKNIFKVKFNSDLEIMRNFTIQVINDLGFENQNYLVDTEGLKSFTRNLLNLTSIEYRTIAEELQKLMGDFVWEGEDANKWYFCFRAANLFENENNRSLVPEDKERIREIILELLKNNGIDSENF